MPVRRLQRVSEFMGHDDVCGPLVLSTVGKAPVAGCCSRPADRQSNKKHSCRSCRISW